MNQLFWSRRDEYDALIGAAEEMRRTNRAVIEGKRGDLRAAGREHERAIDTALKATLAVVKDAGQPVTDTTRHAILNTLRANGTSLVELAGASARLLRKYTRHGGRCSCRCSRRQYGSSSQSHSRRPLSIIEFSRW